MPISGDDKLITRLKKARNISNAMDKWALDGAKTVMEEAQFLIRDGAIPPPNHVPSLPGQPAKEEYGDLARDMAVESLPERGSAAFIAYSDHALATEFGTSKMVERPWARPAASNKRKAILDAARKAVDDVVKGRG